MIATILPGSTNFHAVGYNEHKVSKGLARLIEMKNFGALGIVRPPTTDDKIDFLKKYSSANNRIQKAQFHVAISCKGHEMTEAQLLALRTNISRRWDMPNPDNPGSSMRTTIPTTPTCTW